MKQTITHYLKNQSNNQHIQKTQRWPPTITGANKHDELHRANHENIKKLWRTIENTTRYQPDPIGHVINLNKKTFTKGTFQFLNKNLNFIPTPKVYNKDKLNKELESFYRLLKLKAYFKDNENTKLTTEQQIFKPQKKEKWTPNKNHHTMSTYIEVTQRELEKEQTRMKEKSYNNLTKNERTSMKELSEREDIIITKADKGSAVVIVDVKDYIKEPERQLNNSENYRKLQEDPTATNMKLVNDTIERFKKQKLINEKVAEGLKRNDPKTPKFYLRPKIHKEGNPGRPVVSTVNWHTANISKYVDYHLQPIVKEIPSYVKNTQDFLKKLEKVKDISQETLLVTLDVKSLYTNIPNNEGIKTVKESYEKYKEKTVSTKVIITFLSLILTLNKFTFNCTHYLQTMGYAMGTICAPPYANIFMANFEAKHIYPYIKEKSLLYLRYIDDIFMIWKGTKVELITFIKELNEKHKTIRFDFQISPRKIAFLDAMLYKDENNYIQTTLYRKPTDQQALKLKTICSTSTEFDKNCAIIKQKFLDRQYKEEVLDEHIKKVDRIERKELFTFKEKNNKNRIPLSITYNRTLPNISKIVNRNWNILQINTEFHGVFQATLMIAFKCSQNLQEIMGGHTVKQGKVFKKNLARINRKYVPCSSTRPSLCCTQY